jgi:hypothetical protein
LPERINERQRDSAVAVLCDADNFFGHPSINDPFKGITLRFSLRNYRTSASLRSRNADGFGFSNRFGDYQPRLRIRYPMPAPALNSPAKKLVWRVIVDPRRAVDQAFSLFSQDIWPI